MKQPTHVDVDSDTDTNTNGGTDVNWGTDSNDVNQTDFPPLPPMWMEPPANDYVSFSVLAHGVHKVPYNYYHILFIYHITSIDERVERIYIKLCNNVRSLELSPHIPQIALDASSHTLSILHDQGCYLRILNPTLTLPGATIDLNTRQTYEHPLEEYYEPKIWFVKLFKEDNFHMSKEGLMGPLC